MESLEVAQWIAIGMLIWRVLVLEASQLKKGDLNPIHKSLDAMLSEHKKTVAAMRSLSGLGRN